MVSAFSIWKISRSKCCCLFFQNNSAWDKKISITKKYFLVHFCGWCRFDATAIRCACAMRSWDSDHCFMSQNKSRMKTRSRNFWELFINFISELFKTKTRVFDRYLQLKKSLFDDKLTHRITSHADSFEGTGSISWYYFTPCLTKRMISSCVKIFLADKTLEK